MQVQSTQSAHLINALKYCFHSKPIPARLIIKLSEKLKVNPELLAEQLLDQVKQLPDENSDSRKTIEFLNSALSQSFPISNKLKERIALKMKVSASGIH
ncbi:hypothetical protein [Changchengzhania lutea]|uniref:hypothetical protein n=1 Tax=Changchengzhania lutea TaxID=2049305 RepID=UPI00115CEBC1|nr:hypothetical protein [Changchengzhania lutea]